MVETTKTGRRPGSHAGLLVGLLVVLGSLVGNVTPASAAAPAAIEVVTPTDDLGNGARMRSAVRVSPATNRVDVTTTAWTTWWLVGFTGRSQLALLDAGGNVLAVADGPSVGVTAKAFGWLDSGNDHRRVLWSRELPASIAERVRSVRVVHFRQGQSAPWFSQNVLKPIASHVCPMAPQPISTICQNLV